MISRIRWYLHRLIHSPMRVFALGLFLTLTMLLFDGSLWKYWVLQRSQENMKERMVQLEEKAKNLDFKIHQASQLTYIERQATDQFDYVREGDLIFVFSD